MKKFSKYLYFIFVLVVVFGCTDLVNEYPDQSGEKSVGTRAFGFETTDYYWLQNEKIPLQKIDGKYFVLFDSTNERAFKNELSKVEMTLTNIEKASDYSFDANTESVKMGKIVDYKTAVIVGDYEKVKSALSLALYWGPYYKTDIYQEVWADFKFSVKLKSEADFPLLKKMAEENGVKIVEKDEFIGVYRLACTKDSRTKAVEMGNFFHETGLFEYACASLAGVGSIDCINEPLFTNGTLWHLGNNSTSPDIHINYCNARAIVSQASSAVKIAVVDSGVQYGHSDLYNVLPGWDATSQSSPNRISHSHGTNVAGFIGAIPNNSQGVAGVAYGVTILPISFLVATNGAILSSSNVIVRAIERAVIEGAKVINCSWSFDHPDIIAAIKSALDKDCIVVFASGNGYGAVSSPANSDPRILVVGAISRNANRASFSNYDTRLDIVAPGENLASTTEGGGFAVATNISGTSFAAPQVSAIVALILSAYPYFTQTQVVDLIERTAKKIGSYTYSTQSGRPNGTWNNQMGYGLIDAYKALTATYEISGPDKPAINTVVEYSVPVPPTGVTFTGWTVPGSTAGIDYQVTGATTNRTLNIKFLTAKRHTLTATFRLPDETPGTTSDNPTHTVTKVIDLTPPIVPNMPFISADKVRLLSYDEYVTFYVGNIQQGVTYEWGLQAMQYNFTYYGDTQSVSISSLTGIRNSSGMQPNFVGYSGITAKCRARSGDMVSNWSFPMIKVPCMAMGGIDPPGGILKGGTDITD